MNASNGDIIDALAGIEPGSPLDAIRARRRAARENSEASYALLLRPDAPGDFPVGERRAVAAFVAALHGDEAVAAHYRALLGDGDGDGDGAVADAVTREVGRAAARGPYGAYPAGPLSVEDVDGPRYRTDEAAGAALGARLAAGLEHAHLLVFHPRDASADDLARLLAAGWTPDAIVTLLQLVSFLAFQIRAAIGLRALARAGAAA